MSGSSTIVSVEAGISKTEIDTVWVPKIRRDFLPIQKAIGAAKTSRLPIHADAAVQVDAFLHWLEPKLLSSEGFAAKPALQAILGKITDAAELVPPDVVAKAHELASLLPQSAAERTVSPAGSPTTPGKKATPKDRVTRIMTKEARKKKTTGKQADERRRRRK